MAATSERLREAGVSEREAEVLALLGGHLSHADIGRRLFISVRTVESHVASLRRKLGIPDRRGLLDLAVQHQAATAAEPLSLGLPALPVPLTSFVGRAAEQAALVDALAEARLVSAVGPGGVGKTRLALAVAAAVGERFPGGVGYVELVPVSDQAQVPATVAAALQIAETPGHTREDGLVAGLADSEILLVLDNCEHVVNAVAVLVERLLADCPRLHVLVTSRIRLVVPFERVVLVPGLASAEAQALFAERAGAAGARLPDDDAHRVVAALCEALHGSALAIELAAARMPALGLDGLVTGLGDQLGLLTGGPRLQQRHRSVQDTLDWSYRLLEPDDQAVLRRVSVFAAPFTANAAAEVTGISHTARALGRLVDHSLLVLTPGAATDAGLTRYRALETIGQFSATRMAALGEDDVFARHLDWCLTVTAGLDGSATAFDPVADDLRAALGWACAQPDERARAVRLANDLARLLFLRGRPSEAQQRYEQAGGLTGDPAVAAIAFADAAGVAKCRVAGDDALRLERAAAAAATDAGNPAEAAVTLARASEMVVRFRGMFADEPPPGTAEVLLAEAQALSVDDPRTHAALLNAQASIAAKADDQNPLGLATVAAADRAVDGARRCGDPLIESASLDLEALPLGGHDITAAAANASRRVELLTPLPLTPAIAAELRDALHMATLTLVGAGDLAGARATAEMQLHLPFLREAPDLAAEALLFPAALAGDWHEVEAIGRQFLDGWRRSGRPAGPGRALGPSAVVMAHGLRGDDTGRREWLTVVATLRGLGDPAAAMRGNGYGELFDAVVQLHRGHKEEALALLTVRAGTEPNPYDQLLLEWRLALRAEATGEHTGTSDVSARVRLLCRRLISSR